MKILIYCENKKEVNHLQERIEDLLDNQHIKMEGYTLKDNIDNMIQYHQYDLMVIDTMMKDCSSIEIAKKFRQTNPHCFILFVGEEFQELSQAFRLKAFQYLPTNVADDIFKHALLRVYENYKQKNARCALYTSEGMKLFSPEDILYIETRNHELIMETTQGTFLGSVQNLLKLKTQLLQFHFTQIHQSYFLNMNFIVGIKKGEVTLKNGDVIPTSITNRQTVKESINHFLLFP